MLKSYISRQFGKPEGFGGYLATRMMNKMNRHLYTAVLQNLDIKHSDTILDIGFGNGKFFSRILEQNPTQVLGIDISESMVTLATKNNKQAVKIGKLLLKAGNAENLPFETSSIDKIFTINTLYFWQNPETVLLEIKRVLKPNNGFFLNAFYTKEKLQEIPFIDHRFHLYTLEEANSLFLQNGFSVENIEVSKVRAYCQLIRKIS